VEDNEKVLHPLPCTTVWHNINNQTFRQAIDITATGDHNENGSASDLEYLTGNITYAAAIHYQIWIFKCFINAFINVFCNNG